MEAEVDKNRNYPPPWSLVQIFATVEVLLECASGEEEAGTGCGLKPFTVVEAGINAAIN